MKAVRLKHRRERSVVQRHPWVFSGAIESVEGAPAAGEIVAVTDMDGMFLARGYYNGSSRIRIRLLSWEEDQRIDDKWWRQRVFDAVAARAVIAMAVGEGKSGEPETNAYRLIHAEADRLPGLIVDRYGDVLVVQFLTAGVERARDAIIAALVEAVAPTAIFERSDSTSRKHEELPSSSGLVSGESTSTVAIRESGHRFSVEMGESQKTGFYLDQRDNRVAVAAYATGRRVLDAFCYTGAFSVYAMQAGAKSVTMVDSSAPALEQARRHLVLNDIDASACETEVADVFARLRAYRDEGRRFDMVVLDPPKFASNQHQVEKALRAYKDINMLAMQILEPGGILATFSCSGAVDTAAFTMAIAWAALDAGCDARILHRLSQGADHPILTAFPESEYLKGLLCRVD